MTTYRALDDSARQFNIEVDAAAATLCLAGEIDVNTAPLLLAMAKAVLAESPAEFPGAVTLDLTQVSFADSALLNCIVEIQGATGGIRTEVRLINPSAAITRLIHRGGLTLPPSPDS